MQDIDWSDFQVFLALAHSGRTVDAANLLGVDATTVSRRLKRLDSLSNDHVSSIECSALFNTSTDIWCLRLKKRHSLPLHICSHKCTICIIMFKERN